MEERNLPIEEPTTIEENTQDPAAQAPLPVRKKKKHTLRNILLILLASGIVAIAVVGVLFWKDYSASGRPSETVVITIGGDCSGTAEIANRLYENDLIDHPLFFRVYSRFVEADGTWQAGEFTLSKDMGYDGIIKALQTPYIEKGVDVTIPPQFTVEKIAARLEKKGICSASAFIEAVQNGNYDYDFARSIPYKKERVYRLEGYLFPDTYNFQLDTDPHEVVDRMLANLDKVLTEEVRQQIKARGWSIDDALTFASLIEGEAASKKDMESVSRVLHNRLDPGSGFSKLQLCSTRDYVNELNAAVEVNAYNTYQRDGLPVGPINSPSLQALTAALNPSEDEYIVTCYYFATAYDTGITYFSQTFAQHQAIIDEYGIYDAG